MANGDTRGFGVFMRDLDQLLAAVLVELGDAQADRLPFGLRRKAEVRGGNPLFDGVHHRAVPYLHRDQARLGHADRRDLIERHVAAIGLDLHVIDQACRGAAGAQSAEFGLQRGKRALHAALDVIEIMRWCSHGFPRNTARCGCRCSAERRSLHPANVERPLPLSTAAMAPGSRIENTMIGIRFSRASAKAVASMTFSSRRIASSCVSRSKRSALGS